MKQYILLFVACISFSGLQAQHNPTLTYNIVMDSISKNNPLPTFIVGGLTKNGFFYEYHHGNKLWEGKEPITDNHIFRIYSMTKAITSVAAMQLVEKGKITLDEPLDNLMPEMAEIPILTKEGKLVKATKSITLRHLLTHTAGFAYPFTHNRLNHFVKPADWKYQDLPRVFESGEKWQYGTNIDWVGKIVEKISGQTLEVYFKENITGPLGMARTFFSVPDELVSEITSFGQLKGDQFVLDKEWQYKDLKTTKYEGGGGLFSTFHDYGQFIQCILNDGTLKGKQVLKKSTLDLMFTNNIGEIVTVFEDPSPDYSFLANPTAKNVGVNKFGLGWAVDQTGRKGIREPGTVYWSGIANTFFSIDRKNGKAVLFFSNTLPWSNIHTESAYMKSESILYGTK
jgi:CubicO group peptidase (beta-lactamase class C family)